MRAIICDGFGEPDVIRLGECPKPEAGPGEVLIRTAFAGINRPDLLQRAGKYPPPPGASDIIGLEISGTIEATGPDVTRWKQGDQVCALLAGGGYAEYAVAPAGQCLPLPKPLSLREAALLPETIFTVWANLFDAGKLQAGQSVLIHGGAGGIGSTAIQMAKAIGATVFTTASSPERVAACRKLGADHAINHREEDFVTVVERETAGQGVDFVLDLIGADYVARNLAALGKGGRHISIATQSGSHASVDLRIVMQRQLILTGSTLRPRPVAEKTRLARDIEATVWPWIAAGKVKPLINHVFPLKDAAEAHKMMASGVHIGKIALEVGAA